MNKIKLLFVEDEQALAHIVKDSLESRNFVVELFYDGASAWEAFDNQTYQLAILDIMLPKLDGFALAKRIRQTAPNLPIIFLTARSQPEDVVKGFEIGANDYLKKPFSMEELIVRINYQLGNRCTEKKSVAVLHIGHYQFHPNNQTLTLNGETRNLTHRETEILKRLYENRNQVMERKIVLKELWGDDHFFNARSMDVFITKLRKYLQEDPELRIVNIRGIGYKLIIP